MSAIKGLKDAFREIGKIGQTAPAKEAGKTVSTIAKKSGMLIAAPISLGIGGAGAMVALSAGVNATSKNLSSEVTETGKRRVNKSENDIIKYVLIGFLMLLVLKK